MVGKKDDRWVQKKQGWTCVWIFVSLLFVSLEFVSLEFVSHRFGLGHLHVIAATVLGCRGKVAVSTDENSGKRLVQIVT